MRISRNEVGEIIVFVFNVEFKMLGSVIIADLHSLGYVGKTGGMALTKAGMLRQSICILSFGQTPTRTVSRSIKPG